MGNTTTDEQLMAARERIDEIDKEMAKLFVDRMDAVKDIAAYKKERSLPILNESRELDVVNRNISNVDDSVLRSYYVSYIRNLMDISKQYQYKCIEGTKVAYSGVEGAYANIAASEIFPGGNLIGYKDFKSAYRAVEKGECDSAVLPLENSFAGEVGQVMDLMFSGQLYVNRVYTLKISHCLVGVKGASLSDVKTVVSHQQALDQCVDYIGSHGFDTVVDVNTAAAAKRVAESGDKTVAAIASPQTAALYGLDIIASEINSDAHNTTRFAVFSRIENREPITREHMHFILMFTVKNEAGALAKAINIIGAFDFNMSFLLSRPMKDLPWQYYFYAEIDGNADSDDGKRMLNALSVDCDILKVVGSYQQ